MTDYVVTDFTDTAWKPLTTHAPTLGGPIVNHPTAGGSFYVVGNRAICRSAPAGKGVNYFAGEPASADYTVRGLIRIFDGSGAVGLTTRTQPGSSDFYYAYITNDNGQLVLARMTGGVPASLDVFTSPGFFATGQTYTVDLIVSGTNPVLLSVEVNGVQRADYSDSSGSRITATGRGGIRGIGLSDTTTGKHIDSFRVFDATTPAAGRSMVVTSGL